MTIPPVVAIAVPIAMPIPRALSENVFLPVTPQMIVSVSEIVCVSQIVSIAELRSDVSLVPHACDIWISAIRKWRETIALRDSCYRVWTGPHERTSTRIERPPVRGGW